MIKGSGSEHSATGEPDDPLLDFALALAGVVAVVESGQPADSTPAFERAIWHFEHLELDLSWLSLADMGLALPPISLLVIQLARIRELLVRDADRRLRSVYDARLEYLLAAREIDIRVGLATRVIQEDLDITLAELAARLGLPPGAAVALVEGRLRTGADLAEFVDLLASRRAAEYLDAIGGSASAAVLSLDLRRSQLAPFLPQG